MPIYGFECGSCGHRFDRLQKLSDPDPTVCPDCGAEQLRRQLTAPSFRLSGSGWYETDFKKDGDKKRNLADKPDGGTAPDAAAGKDTPKGEPSKAANATSKADAAPGAPAPKPAASEPKPAAKPPAA